LARLMLNAYRILVVKLEGKTAWKTYTYMEG
jgi:hypothetical protein